MKTIILFSLVATVAFAVPMPLDAPLCRASNCYIQDNCKCSTLENPITDASDRAPQLIAITVSESIVITTFDEYLAPIFFHRENPDGRPISMTYYINHEYTDYTLVNQLYLRGFEIGTHSVTKNFSQEYWRTASKETLIEEFGGQRQILAKFANIPIGDITGARTPQLQLQGDLSIEAYEAAGVEYDNSWPTYVDFPYYPYTLDYKSDQQCVIGLGNCPKESHKGFWVAPITNIQGHDRECNSLATCLVTGTAEEISSWLLGEVDRLRNGNRAPLVIRLDSYWFKQTNNSLEGFSLFLDQLTDRTDTFLVSVQDVLKWTKNPVPASRFSSTDNSKRNADCFPERCVYNAENGQQKYMDSCTACPPAYPWLGNPLGEIKLLR